MKNLVLFAIVAFGLSLASCEKEDAITMEESSSVAVVKSVSVDPQEIADLTMLREEEKLARDVYIYAYSVYGKVVFNNISKSEQTHMDKVLEVLDLYGISDPASPIEGVFNDSTLQQLYHDLTALVDVSLLSAYIVGATIEDLDIYDIREFMTHTPTTLILDMYDNLACGSGNHLRSFYSNILAVGGTYTPQFISLQDFDDIINSPYTNCGIGTGGNGNNNGSGNGSGGNCNGTGTGTGHSADAG